MKKRTTTKTMTKKTKNTTSEGSEASASGPSKAEQIEAVEPEYKDKPKRRQTSATQKKPWVGRKKEDLWNELQDAKQAQVADFFTEEQTLAITGGLLAILQVTTTLPYTSVSSESKEALSNNIKKTVDVYMPQVEPKYAVGLMLLTSFALVSVEAYSLKMRDKRKKQESVSDESQNEPQYQTGIIRDNAS